MNKIPYKERDILFEIEHKIGTFNKTRNNKIKQSLRLEEYAEMWKVVTFILNIEAVIFVILSLGAEDKSIFDNEYFVIISSVFSIYVILIQYYISEQRYGERALKAHYQQLHIEDIILSLKSLLIMKNSMELEIKDNYLINEFNRLVYEYQTILKNNENHSPIDFLLASAEATHSNSLPEDFTKDNLMIYSNLIFCILIPLIIFFVLIFT